MLCRKFDKGVVYSIKRQKSSNDDNEGKSAFQKIAMELSKQPKKAATKKKEHLRLVISSKVGAVSSVLEQLTVVLLQRWS